MKIISWNVNGIRSRIFNEKISSEIKRDKIIIPEENSPIGILLKQYDPDVFCFQETRCSIKNGEKFNISGYKGIFNESKLEGNRSCDRYSGTSIFIKESINVNKVEYSIPEYHDLEGRIIIIYTDDYIIINVYSPNSGSNYENKIKFMECILKFLDNLTGRIIFCGDMNIAIDTHFDKTKKEPGPGFYKHELEFYDKLKGINFVDSISKEDDIIYTWWDPRQRKENGMSMSRNRNKGWRLDYFFLKGCNQLSSKVLKHIGENNNNIPLASDHAPILLSP
tara:strand:- start:768 stop:1604 length:837 start_codon:yes stop_codon:yes gene_type:complete